MFGILKHFTDTDTQAPSPLMYVPHSTIAEVILNIESD